MTSSKPKRRNMKTTLRIGRATVVKLLLVVILIPIIAIAAFLIRYYYIFDGTIEMKLGQRHQLAETKIYAAPTVLYPGKQLDHCTLVSKIR